MFGCCNSDFEFQPYVPKKRALSEVIGVQNLYPWDPRRPATVPALTLFNRVTERLDDLEAEHLEFLCAIGTAMDFNHEADAVMMIRPYFICIDLRIIEPKYPTDSVIVMPEDFMSGKRLAKLADTIADIFHRR